MLDGGTQNPAEPRGTEPCGTLWNPAEPGGTLRPAPPPNGDVYCLFSGPPRPVAPQAPDAVARRGRGSAARRTGGGAARHARDRFLFPGALSRRSDRARRHSRRDAGADRRSRGGGAANRASRCCLSRCTSRVSGRSSFRPRPGRATCSKRAHGSSGSSADSTKSRARSPQRAARSPTGSVTLARIGRERGVVRPAMIDNPRPAAPKRARSWREGGRLRRIFYDLRTEASGPGRDAAALGVGVLIGCSPFYGFHLLLVWSVGWLLRLNRLKMYLAANISNPLSRRCSCWRSCRSAPGRAARISTSCRCRRFARRMRGSTVATCCSAA